MMLPVAMIELTTAAQTLIATRFVPQRHVIAAAVRGLSGKIYSAVSLDCHLRRASVCAEGAAISTAISAGETGITAIAAIRQRETGESYVVSPCGICRELITDYGPDADVVVPAFPTDKIAKIGDLLPDRYAK